MTTSRTADNLVYEVAGLLGIVEAGETLGSVEYDTINSAIDPVLEEVSAIVNIGDRDDIPTRYFQTLARLVTVHAAAKFSNTPLDLAAVAQHETRLRYLAAAGPSYQPLKVDYF
ncbi:hypothetical protein [Bradyrhizobium oligotrophicum]|uniref:hypothetical protein n=1 Tax=Bradyrhizobium oligotrophicum TaxID=44255 RepID=UPI003EC13C08